MSEETRASLATIFGFFCGITVAIPLTYRHIVGNYGTNEGYEALYILSGALFFLAFLMSHIRNPEQWG